MMKPPKDELFCPFHLEHAPGTSALLVKKYRVIRRIAHHRAQPRDGALRYTNAYIPIWVCETHKFSVEINRLSKHVVARKPTTVRPKHPPGSAAD